MSLKKRIRSFRDALATQRLHRDAGLEIRAMKGAGETGIVVFTSLHGSFATSGQLEFAGTASARGTRPSVFVRDRRKAWFQDPAAMGRIVETVRAHWHRQGVSRVMTVGDSMGAYAALVFARDLGADTALAFGPQYDVSRAAMPDDPRWPDYRDAIAEFGLGCIEPWLDPGTDYYVLHGREGADIVHWSRFPEAANLHHYLIEGRNHPVALELKSEGLLTAVFEAALGRDPAGFDALMARAGGRRRRPGESYLSDPNEWYLTRFPELMEGVDLSGTPHARRSA